MTIKPYIPKALTPQNVFPVLEANAETIRARMNRIMEKSSCIATSQVIADVLTQIGVPAFPLVMRVQAMATEVAQIFAAMESGDVDPEEGQRQVLAIGRPIVYIGWGGKDKAHRLGEVDVESNTWLGHLVTIGLDHEGQKWLLDLTLDQGARPGLALKPLVAPVEDYFLTEGGSITDHEAGTFVQYTPYIRERSYDDPERDRMYGDTLKAMARAILIFLDRRAAEYEAHHRRERAKARWASRAPRLEGGKVVWPDE